MNMEVGMQRAHLTAKKQCTNSQTLLVSKGFHSQHFLAVSLIYSNAVLFGSNLHLCGCMPCLPAFYSWWFHAMSFIASLFPLLSLAICFCVLSLTFLFSQPFPKSTFQLYCSLPLPPLPPTTPYHESSCFYCIVKQNDSGSQCIMLIFHILLNFYWPHFQWQNVDLAYVYGCSFLVPWARE